MEVLPIQVRLAREDPQLRAPRLNALQANHEYFRVFAIQPEAKILIAPDGIAHQSESHATRMRDFFRLVSEQKPDLAIAPEYCVPWQVLTQALKAGMAPTPAALWIVGCESLPIGKLAQYREELKGIAMVLDDPPDQDEITTKRYLNPVAIIFWATVSGSDTTRLVVLVQYKTWPSGDHLNTETQGMQPGHHLYKFGEAPQEIQLLTLICSDVFNPKLDEAFYQKNSADSLIVHIQLNNNPRNSYYKQYRLSLFKFGGETELICLNWAQNAVATEGDKTFEWKNIGGSGWYLRSRQCDTTDDAIHANHERGVYYTYSVTLSAHVLHLHYSPRVFSIRSTKVKHFGVIAPTAYRTGPKVDATYQWNSTTEAWTPEVDAVPDGFHSSLPECTCAAFGPEVTAIESINPAGAERLFAISAGDIGPSATWYHPTHLDSMKLGEEEIVQRVTVAMDPLAADYRVRRIAAGANIAELRAVKFEWPPEVGFLNSGFQFHWTGKHPHRNIKSSEGRLATVVHAGSISDTRFLETLDTRVRRAMAQVTEPEAELDEANEKRHRYACETLVPRLCVLHTTATGTKVYRDPARMAIASPANYGSTRISASTGPSRKKVGGDHAD